MSANAIESLQSDLLDCGDMPLDHVADDVEFRQIMHRVGIVEGEPGTPVSHFNSSI
jgi:hypothetical protein